MKEALVLCYDAPHVGNFFDCVRTRQKPIASVAAGFIGATACRMALLSEEGTESAKWDNEKEVVLL